MQATTTKGLRIQALELENWLRLRTFSVDADGHHVKLSGPNGSGKTSVLDAIWAAIRGVSTRQFPEPIHQGAKSARMRLDLGEVTIERKVTPKGAGLEVTRKDGSRVPKPQTFLDSLFATICLDPGQFLTLRPQDQVDQVLAVCGVVPPVDAVLAIAGSEASRVADGSKPNIELRPNESAAAYLERLSADETGLFYVRRREANREATEKAAALEEQRRRFQDLGGPPGAGEAEESMSDLAKQLGELDQAEQQRQAIGQQAADAERELRNVNTKLEGLKTERAREVAEFDALQAKIQDMMRQQEARREKATQLAERIERATGQGGAIHDLKADAESLADAFRALPDRGPERAELRRKIADSERRNKSLIERRLWAQQIDVTTRQAEEAAAAHERLDRILDELRSLRRNLLDGVDLGITGLELGEGELRLNDVPLRQASRAQQLEVALALAMRGDPELRLIRMDDAEHLDRAARERVLELADKRGYQVFMTTVADDGPLSVEIIED